MLRKNDRVGWLCFEMCGYRDVWCCLCIFIFSEIRGELALTDTIRAKSQFGEVERDSSRKDT